ncbi:MULTISPECIES: hypothetical protein [unclassified Paenibacillus]|uniref:hypothetical protein n=1 Tax=unclassified Paenibacillus TaxID=185978 RepID=UPI0030FB6B88
MRVFTADSLRHFYLEDIELFEEITGLNLDDYDHHNLITLTNEQITELKNKNVFVESTL